MKILTEGRKEFLAWANGNKELLNKFLEFRKKVSGNEADMDWWVKNKTPEELEELMANFKSKTAKEKEERIAGSEKIYDDGRWAAIRCDTYDAMKHYGSGSKWCISGRYPGHEGDSRGKYYFDEYLKSNYSSYTVVIDRKAPEGDNKWCVCIKKNADHDDAACDIWNAKDSTVPAIPGVPNIPGLPDISMFTIVDGELLKSKSHSGRVEVPEGVTKIHAKLFMDSSVGEITLPDSLQEIGAGVLANSSIHKIVIPNTVNKLGRGVCMSCDDLTNVLVGTGVKEIPDLCFSYCDRLEKVELYGGDKVLGDRTFYESGTVSIFVDSDDCPNIIDWAKDKKVYIINRKTMEIIGGSDE